MADATYAQFVVVPQAIVTHLPNGIELIDAAAISLVLSTGDQLVRFAPQAVLSQTILFIGALGSVGRAAVHISKKLGAKVVVGVRARQLAEAESLAHSAVALDDDDAIAKLDVLEGVAYTVGGAIAAKLLGKVWAGGLFGYASVLPDDAATETSVVVSRVFAKPDPSMLSVSARHTDGGWHLNEMSFISR